MIKFIQKINLKSALAVVVFLFISINTFGQTAKKDSLYQPEVYVSTAPVSEISGHELIEKPWFWILIAVILIVAVTAFFAEKDKDEHESQAL
nr:hypothetical protein [Pseudopedobacter sp.]